MGQFRVDAPLSMIHEKKITVCYAETGVDGKLKPVSVLNYLQDITSDHTGEMGVSAIDMLPKGLAWVVFKYQINIFKYPLWKDALRVRTWRYPLKNLYELRQFEIIDEADNLLISSKSLWILTSLATKKPVRLQNNLPSEMIEGRQKAITNDLITLPEITDPDLTRPFTIRMHDLDFNRHVNNSVYVVWGIESVPQKIITTHRPSEITINYLSDSVYGDGIISKTQRLDSNPSPTFMHSIINDHSQKEITRIKTVWERFE
jgi:acyl-ACP thioesterase